jgi:HAD superfamily hydrolase (TIGR01509 family)
VSSAIRLVIFDCDGVLVDSEPIAVRIDIRLLAELGWVLTEAEVIERFMGRSEKHMIAEIEAHLGRRLPPEWANPFESWYRKAFEEELKPVDGIIEALDAITLPSCVASSSTHERIRFTLRLTGLYPRFEGRIFSVVDVARGKPAPDLFLHAAARMGVAPEHCVVVEDSRYGVEAARAAGMRAFGYVGGLTPRGWLEGPDTVLFEDMRELPRLLAG